MGDQVDGAQVADSGFRVGGIECNLGTKVRAMDNAFVLLRAAQIACVFEGDPWVPRFEQHAQHLAPERYGRDALVELDLPSFGHGFIAFVSAFEFRSIEIVQIRYFIRTEQSPL